MHCNYSGPCVEQKHRRPVTQHSAWKQVHGVDMTKQDRMHDAIEKTLTKCRTLANNKAREWARCAKVN